MYSTVGIYNLALARLGGNELTSLTSTGDSGRVASLCNTFFAHTRDRILASHPWGFALASEMLALKGDGDERYRFAYGLPKSCIRPVEIRGNGAAHDRIAYVIQGDALYTDAILVELAFVQRVQDPAQWPAFFADAVAWGLAAELCTAYLNDIQRQKFCIEMRERALAQGRAEDMAINNPKRRPCIWDEARG